MRNVMFLLLLVTVFMFSGCGGSLDPEEDTEPEIPVPNNLPDTYNATNVLEGTWLVTDDLPEMNPDDYESHDVLMRMASGYMVFSDVKTEGNTGTSYVSSHQEWHLWIDGNYYGLVPIDIDSEVMNMIHVGADRWRCEIYDSERTVLNIEITSESTIRAAQIGVAPIGENILRYNNTFNFRKQ